MRIVLAQINPIVGDLAGNLDKILRGISFAKQSRADIVLFPELSLTGYPPDDFLLLPHFISALDKPLKIIQEASKGLTVIVGTPRRSPGGTEKHLFNSAAIFSDGELLGYQDKSLLPTYDIFDERRYFEPAKVNQIWKISGRNIAITICEDLWQHSAAIKYTSYLRDPVAELQNQHPSIVLNLSASPYSFGKSENRINVCKVAAKALKCPLLFCNQVGGSNGLIFDGHSLHIDAKGKVMHRGKGFEEDLMLIDLSEHGSPCTLDDDPIEMLYEALVLGVRDYFRKLGFTKACFGLSGGIDSALVACIATEALGKDNLLAIIMPSRFTPESSMKDAEQLAQTLGIPHRTIPIESPFKSYLDLLTPHFAGKPADTTEENLQARIRAMILMAMSNKFGYLVLSTGNKSELAMGYATLYGDMCGGLGVISDVTKRQVYALSNWINRNGEIIPKSTITKPPSAELKPNQKDTDSLPDYDIVDNVLEAYVESYLSPEQIAKKFDYSLDLVQGLIRRIHRNEYKRRQSPPGLRVTEKAFSIGRHFPIVQRWIT